MTTACALGKKGVMFALAKGEKTLPIMKIRRSNDNEAKGHSPQ